jgi:chitinase
MCTSPAHIISTTCFIITDPKNVDFSKYDRINYAFFQPDKEGNIYGTDEWAGECTINTTFEYS